MRPAALLLVLASLLTLAQSPAQAQPATPSTLDAVRTHLEFLGYACDQKPDKIVATHETKLNVIVQRVGTGILFTAYFTGKDKSFSPAKLGFTNTLNREATLARFYWDKDGDLVMEAWQTGAYDKPRYAEFMESWDADAGLLSKHDEDLKKLVK